MLIYLQIKVIYCNYAKFDIDRLQYYIILNTILLIDFTNMDEKITELMGYQLHKSQHFCLETVEASYEDEVQKNPNIAKSQPNFYRFNL